MGQTSQFKKTSTESSTLNTTQGQSSSTSSSSTLPQEVRFLSEEEVFKRYGKTTKDAFHRVPGLASSAKKIWDSPLSEFYGIEDNKVIKLGSGQSFLLLAGRTVDLCGGKPTIIAYDLKKQSIAALTYYRELEDVPEHPDANRYSLIEHGTNLTNGLISVLWKEMMEVSPADGDFESDCYHMYDNDDASE